MYIICLRQVVDLNSGFEWFVKILIELPSKILNVKKYKFLRIEDKFKEAAFQNYENIKKREPSVDLTTSLVLPFSLPNWLSWQAPKINSTYHCCT